MCLGFELTGDNFCYILKYTGYSVQHQQWRGGATQNSSLLPQISLLTSPFNKQYFVLFMIQKQTLVDILWFGRIFCNSHDLKLNKAHARYQNSFLSVQRVDFYYKWLQIQYTLYPYQIHKYHPKYSEVSPLFTRATGCLADMMGGGVRPPAQ